MARLKWTRNSPIWDAHLVEESLELAQGRGISSTWPTDRYHSANYVESVVESIDEDQPVHRVPEVSREVERGNDCDDTQARERRSSSRNNPQYSRLVVREGRFFPAIQHHHRRCGGSRFRSVCRCVLAVGAWRLTIRGQGHDATTNESLEIADAVISGLSDRTI